VICALSAPSPPTTVAAPVTGSSRYRLRRLSELA